jgi:hypothetical protein
VLRNIGVSATEMFAWQGVFVLDAEGSEELYYNARAIVAAE